MNMKPFVLFLVPLMHTCILSTKWVDYVEKPMKYQAFLHNFVSVEGWLEGSWGGWVGGFGWIGWCWGGCLVGVVDWYWCGVVGGWVDVGEVGWWWVVGVVVVEVGGVVGVQLLGVPLVLFLVPLMHACIFCQFGENNWFFLIW